MNGNPIIGRRIGRYEITGEIGRGGMGIVYRAIQTSLNRTVAVKMLPFQLASAPEFLSRFQREAETLARLNHENIVHIYDVEEWEGNHFIVMEYVGGPSLARLLQERRVLPLGAARDIAAALASGLAVTHRQGVIHRDIKPDNILFTPAGVPKLTDFGIALAEDARLRTQSGVMMGTPYYLSPEQARGLRVTEQSDLYSLGVVLFEAVAGHRPFDAATQVLIFIKHLEEAAPSLAATAADLRPEEDLARIRHSGLESLVDRLLHKDPSGRPSGAQALEAELLRLDLDTAPGRGLRLLFPQSDDVEITALPPRRTNPPRRSTETVLSQPPEPPPPLPSFVGPIPGGPTASSPPWAAPTVTPITGGASLQSPTDSKAVAEVGSGAGKRTGSAGRVGRWVPLAAVAAAAAVVITAWQLRTESDRPGQTDGPQGEFVDAEPGPAGGANAPPPQLGPPVTETPARTLTPRLEQQAKWEIAAVIQRFCLAVERGDPEGAIASDLAEPRAALTSALRARLAGLSAVTCRASNASVELVTGNRARATFDAVVSAEENSERPEQTLRIYWELDYRDQSWQIVHGRIDSTGS